MTGKYVEKSKIFAKMMLYGFRAPDMTVTEFVDDLPVADVQEVKHGHWVITEYEYYDCSVCGDSYFNGCDSHAEARERLEKRLYDVYSYCPYCGAKMDEKENEK